MNIVDTKTLADILKVDVETIRRMVKRGTISCLKISSREYRFDVDAVIEELKANKE